MEPPRFVIEASEAESMAQKAGLTLVELLPTLVKSAQSLARPPISDYYVGAVGLGSSGRIFFGANLEFPGLPLHQSVHAEQFLITNLFLNAESNLKYVAVSAAPCGHCRQFFQEIRDAPDIQILITGDSNNTNNNDQSNGDIKRFDTLSNLLPQRFGPYDLLDKSVPLVLEKHNNHMSLQNDDISNNSKKVPNGISISVFDDLKLEALEAANSSHAPYSKCPSGVALMDCEGKVYKGSYMESAAYNPSLGPVQAAIVAYLVGGGGGYEKIVAAVLVEKEEAVVRQEFTARLLLQVISPRCEFKVFHCSSSKS
ncbi:cytidine deaminase 1 [Ricinus communis]|uniref:cytidine deaminase n=1 Tax=Ricinus communis TaxID=3988 RepID=B9RK96_RICCO|nr:cytidine deaminase 1 [Ricinus communis]EEF48094.1 cytidine deaminase 1, 2, 7, putative [Ricinus communis]|eukprot:XP_002514140.1 cytidine deaminase 1 [Ricinus communis]